MAIVCDICGSEVSTQERAIESAEALNRRAPALLAFAKERKLACCTAWVIELRGARCGDIAYLSTWQSIALVTTVLRILGL